MAYIKAQKLVLKPEKVLRDFGIRYCTNLQLYKVHCTGSSKFNIQPRAAVAMQVLSGVVFILVEEVLRGQTKLSLESFIFWPTKQSHIIDTTGRSNRAQSHCIFSERKKQLSIQP